MTETDICTVDGCHRPVNRDGVCFPHKLQTVSLSDKATPTRKGQKIYKPKTIEKMREHRANSNAWERGTAIDRRNPDGTVMPILKPNGLPMGLKEYADNRRRIDKQRQKVKETGRLAS